MIGITLQFPNVSNRKKVTFKYRAEGVIKIFLCSVYHPYEHDEQKEFQEELDSFYSRKPRNSEILPGAEINATSEYEQDAQ